ncbi:MAG: glycine betaine ABC transporter substrate-binding protein [Dehalococcoidales bacterium]|nr:glycine betaine ABC transporter substrate-binding protein [Dehalococcoidales bacterium]
MRQIRLLIIFTLVVSVIAFLVPAAGCSQSAAEPQKNKPTIGLVEADWTSNLIGTEIARQVITEQLGYPVEVIQTSVTAGWAAMARGDADAAVECWLPQRYPEIQPFLDKGDIELGTQIFPGGGGWFMPRFVSEGNAERGIQPIAPGLKSILDLKEYWKIFENPENPGIGELVGGSPGWTDDPQDRSMIRAYDLPMYRSNQSEAVMCARMIAADKKGEPLLMFMWWPHWIFAQVDMVMLEEPDPWYEGAFADDSQDYKAGHPPYDVRTVTAPRLRDTAPDVHNFIMNLEMGEEAANELMLRVDVNKEEVAAVATDWIKQNQSRIDEWIKQ